MQLCAHNVPRSDRRIAKNNDEERLDDFSTHACIYWIVYHLACIFTARVQLFRAIVAHNVLGVIVELQRAMTGNDWMISQRMHVYTG